MPLVWPHNNAGKLQQVYVQSMAPFNGGAVAVTTANSGLWPFGVGVNATSGDSGSPNFLIQPNNVPIVVMAITYGAADTNQNLDASGYFISDPNNFGELEAIVGANGIKFVNLNNFPYWPPP